MAPTPRGITLLDLVAVIPGGAHDLIPDGIARVLEHLSVVESASRQSGGYDVVEGTARSVVEAFSIELGDGFTAELPGVTRGLRFVYASNRVAPAVGQNLEPAPTPWQLSLFAERLLVPLPGLAAQRVATTDGFVGPLVPDPDRERVHLWVSGVIVIGNAGGSVQARLAAEPDPFQPDAPSGTILRAGLEPRHVLFAPNGFGMTVGEVLWDQTTAVTPPEIVARGHDAAWRGLSISDATLYLPRDLPFVGDVTAGVRDLLIGFAPDNGVQLEAFLQLGEVSRLDRPDGDVHKVALHLYQDVDGQLTALTTPAGPSRQREVEVVSTAAGDPVRVLARLSPPDAQGRWRLPGSTTWTTGNDTGWVVVRPGDPHDTLGYRDVFVLEDGREADGPELTFAFVPGDGALDDGGFPPKIRLWAEPFSWSDVTHVSGTSEHLAGVWFEAIDPLPADADDVERITWELSHGGSARTGTGGRFTPTGAWRTGRHTVVLTDHRGRRRRLEVDVLDDADRMVIGCAAIDGAGPLEDRAGPRLFVEEVDQPAVPTAVVASYHLRAFHQEGATRPADEPATLHPLTIPDGTLAELALAEDDDDATHVLSAVRVRMAFDSTDPVLYREVHPTRFTTDQPGFEGTHVDPWGPPDPYPVWAPHDPTTGTADRLRGFAEGADPKQAAAAVLRAWAADVLDVDPDARFVVIGRTCDIGDDAYNTVLGGRRAAQGRALLTDPALGPDAVDSSLVYSRGENEPASAAVGTMPSDPTVLPDMDDPTLVARSLDERTRIELRIKVDHADRLAEWGESRSIPEREEARGFDVYAVVPDPWQASLGDDDAVAPSRRRTLVPGADRWAHITEPPRERDLGMAARLLARWDSPSWVDAQDSAPTLVELAVDWEQRRLEIPVLGGAVEPEALDPPEPGETKVWQVVLRFANDPRSRQMVLTGAIDTPGSDEGLFRITDTSDGANGIASDLALVLALGPALATGVDAADASESVVPLLALAGVAATSAVFDVARNGVTTVHRVELGYGRAAGSSDPGWAHRFWLYADYTAAFDVVLPAGLATGTGVAVRYRRAGIELSSDVGIDDLNRVGLAYEEGAEVVTPGTWAMNNTLARLLGVVAVRMGAGSVWIEVDLVLAVDLGPVRLEQATLRLTLGTEVVFELRGLTASISIPDVIEGRGHLAITEGGSGALEVSAALDLAIEPIGLGIDASFVYRPPMAHLEVAVTFATPIPLLNTGLGLFGLQGRVVSNGTRALPSAAAEPDPVQRELRWLETDTEDKYRPEPGQVALGVGATLGTQADGGFTFNLNGMLAVELPDPSVVLTVAARFVSVPEGAEEDAPPSSTTGAGLLGIVAVSSDGLAVGIRGTYGVPSLLDVQVPVAAWFPFAGPTGGYVRVGSDGFGGRAGDPVTITVLPGTLDLQAWAYLMIEEKELRDLGGKGEDWDFTGFSIGFGAGYDFEWGGDTVSLRAGSSIVVGLGTKPLFLKGELTTGGELRFGPVGVSITGDVDLTLTEHDAQLSGEFCGEVDLAFIKAKGCVEITVGGAQPPDIDADLLVQGVSLTDRYARVVATARSGTSGTPGPEHTAWVDCRPTLHFSKRVLSALETGSFRPTPSSGWGADWGGSARTKFLYRLRAVELLDADGRLVTDAAEWPSVWWLPAGRPAIPADGDPPSSEHEMWDLALLAWDPAPWARNLLDGGAGAAGDPADVVERLCDPVPTTTRHCVLGSAGERVAADRVRFSSQAGGPLPWRSGASLVGTETAGVPLEAWLTWGDLTGYAYEPGRVAPLAGPWAPDGDGDPITAMWLLPRSTKPDELPISLGFDGSFSRDVEAPELVVALSVPIPVSGSEVELCFGFDDLGDGPQAPDVVDYGVIRVTGQTGITYAGDGNYLLVFDGELVVELHELAVGPFTYGSPTHVRCTVAYSGTEPVRMKALDADGAVLAEAEVPADHAPGVPYTLELTAAGMTTVVLWAEPTPPGVTQVLTIDACCVQVQVAFDQGTVVDNTVAFLEEAATLLAPAATGRRDAGDAPWPVTLLDVVASDTEAAAILRYAPAAGDDGPWTGVLLDPALGVDVGLVRSCFTTTAATEAAEAADDARNDLLDAWNSVWDAPVEDRVVLLDAGTTYAVRVRYDVAEWNQSGSSGPPAAGSLDWDDPPSTVRVQHDLAQTFEFATASEGTLAEADLLRFDVQHAFDPRALARHVIGFDPDSSGAPHFLDDQLLVHFDVDWIEPLLARYGYELSLDVVRTDPAPGTTTGFDDRVVASTFTWSSATSTMQSSPADARLAAAALLAPCVEGPLPQGATACVQAELAPRAEYDLLVRAVPANRPLGTAVVVARSHFTTSAYRNADELLAAAGFDADDPGADPIFPWEAMAAAAAPPDVRLGDDVALDEALAAMGLDPMPLPDEPGAVVLWVQGDGVDDWKVAGVLLDSTEALARPPRLEDVLDDSPPGPPTVTLAAVEAGGRFAAVRQADTGALVDYRPAPERLAILTARIGTTALTPRRANASSTRVLLVPDAPFTPGPGDTLELEWDDRGRTRRARRSVASVPRLVSQEWV